jgi:hypothetical protein
MRDVKYSKRSSAKRYTIQIKPFDPRKTPSYRIVIKKQNVVTKQIVNHQSSYPVSSGLPFDNVRSANLPFPERINTIKQPSINTIAPDSVLDDIPKAPRTIRVLLATVHNAMSTVLRQRAAIRVRRRTLHLACDLGSQVLAKRKVTALLNVLEHVLSAYGEGLVRVYMLVR